MSNVTTYKNPPEQFMSIVRINMATIGEFVKHRKRAKDAMEEIIFNAKKYNIPDAQLRQILQQEWTKLQLSQRTFLLYLPKQLKNQNMVRSRPKKDPLVKEWEIEFSVTDMERYIAGLLNDGKDKGYIVHDNKRVVDVYGK